MRRRVQILLLLRAKRLDDALGLVRAIVVLAADLPAIGRCGDLGGVGDDVVDVRESVCVSIAGRVGCYSPAKVDA